MPYIKKTDRARYEETIEEISEIVKGSPVKAGELNFIITKLLLLSFDLPDCSYEKINTIIGILECCKQEMYRRLSNYENKKIASSGDIEEFIIK